MIRAPFEPAGDRALSAFADGELPPRLGRRVAAELRRRPELADRLHDYWRREAALIRAFESAAGDAATVDALPTAPRRRGLLVSSTAAGLVAAGVGAVLLWPSTAPPSSAAALTRDILQAYASPVAERPATDASATSPLSGLGLDYTGRHRVRVGDRRLNEYRYRDGRGHQLALYRLPRQQDAADGWLRVSAGDTTRVPMVRWSQGPYSYVLVGGDRSLMLARLALRIRQQLTHGRPNGGPETRTPDGAPGPSTPEPSARAPSSPESPTPKAATPARADAPIRRQAPGTSDIDYRHPARRTSDM